MTPSPFREALDALERKWQALWNARLVFGGRRQPGELVAAVVSARAEVERLYAARVGEEYEVTMVVNPEYPADRHYWDNGNIPTFPANYRLTPGVFRVTKGEAG